METKNFFKYLEKRYDFVYNSPENEAYILRVSSYCEDEVSTHYEVTRANALYFLDKYSTWISEFKKGRVTSVGFRYKNLPKRIPSNHQLRQLEKDFQIFFSQTYLNEDYVLKVQQIFFDMAWEDWIEYDISNQLWEDLPDGISSTHLRKMFDSLQPFTDSNGRWIDPKEFVIESSGIYLPYRGVCIARLKRMVEYFDIKRLLEET